MSKRQESTSIYICAENWRLCPRRRSNIYLNPICHGGIENATFGIPYLKKKKTTKLLSRQKQQRGGGGRCCWQVYYATEATGEADNREMELSQHFSKWQISLQHQRVSLCHSSMHDAITASDVLHLSQLCWCSLCSMKYWKRRKLLCVLCCECQSCVRCTTGTFMKEDKWIENTIRSLTNSPEHENHHGQSVSSLLAS